MYLFTKKIVMTEVSFTSTNTIYYRPFFFICVNRSE